MTWITDTDFFNSNFLENPLGAFVGAGNASVLNLSGCGYRYNDDLNHKNVLISCQLIVRAYGQGIQSPGITFGPTLIARRQSDGSFYCVSVDFSESSGGSRALDIRKYNGTSFTSLSSNSVPKVNLPYPANEANILTLEFRLEDSNLSARLLQSNGSLVVATSITDTFITTTGHVGIGSHLIPNGNGSYKNLWLTDNLTVYRI